MGKDNLDFSIKIEDNTVALEKEFNIATERALYAMGIKAVEGATYAISGKYNIISAVDTGRLRASISFITPLGDMSMAPAGIPKLLPPAQIPKAGISNEKLSKNKVKKSDYLSGKAEERTVIIGTNVEYAEYVHNGTTGMAARPFLREGIDKTKEIMKEQVNRIFKGEL